MSEVATTLSIEFGEQGALRQPVGQSGRVHLDRWLPFVVIHRGEPGPGSLAHRVAINSSAYMVWGPDDDDQALPMLADIIAAIEQHTGAAPLIFALSDQPRPHGSAKAPWLPRFVAQLGETRDASIDRSVGALEMAIERICVDLRHCEVEREIAGRSTAVPRGVPSINLCLPSIHIRADGGVYPQLEHDLSVAFGDALLQAACAFVDDGKRPSPPHYRALGRQAFLAAAKSADRKLATVAQSFDFLLSVSPINTSDACEEFLAAKENGPPHFRYRPLAVDPDQAKRSLYDIDLSAIEDPLLERLLSEKRREIDFQLTMLATRNTPAFGPASTMVYGIVEPALLDDALGLLDDNEPKPPRGESVDAEDVADAARALIASYQTIDERFAAKVEIRDDVSGLMVSGPKLMIGRDSIMPANRLDALLAHEVSVHLLTFFNGAAQGLKIFRSGLANYEGVQEGLGVFAEWAVGGLTRTRLRLLAGRVVAVNAMQHGADFMAVYNSLVREHGFRKRGAFGIAARVFRSGGMAKDAIYLRGFRQVVDLAASGASLAPFWLGKIAPDHAAAIEELLLRGLVHQPLFLPEFLSRPAPQARIAQLQDGLGFQSMFKPETLPC